MLDQAESIRAALDLRLEGRPMTGPGKISTAARRVAAIWQDRPDALQLAFCDCAGITGLWTPFDPDNPGSSWDAHQELSRELVSLGVPRAVIRVVQGRHDWWGLNDELAAEILNSQVRIVITDTWNALPAPLPGLGAVHHLDPPANPGGLDLREGAIQLADVQVIRYITTDCPDSTEWQALDRQRPHAARETASHPKLADRAGREKATRLLTLDDPGLAAIETQLGSATSLEERIWLSARAIAARTRTALPEASAVVMGWNDLGELRPAGFLDRRGHFIGWGTSGLAWDKDWESDAYRREIINALERYCDDLNAENQALWSKLTTPPPAAVARVTGGREYCIPVAQTLAETSIPHSQPRPAQSISALDFPSSQASHAPPATPADSRREGLPRPAPRRQNGL
jgi:hypothetical protein